jgi:hypothetical protein
MRRVAAKSREITGRRDSVDDGHEMGGFVVGNGVVDKGAYMSWPGGCVREVGGRIPVVWEGIVIRGHERPISWHHRCMLVGGEVHIVGDGIGVVVTVIGMWNVEGRRWGGDEWRGHGE